MNIYKTSFKYSLITLIYIIGVSYLIKNGEKIFDEMNNFLGPIAFLLLFTFSALMVGSLILGKPVMLYIDGQKKEAIRMLLASLTWLGLFTTIALLLLVIF